MQLKPTNLSAIFVSFHNTAWQTTSGTNRGMQFRYYSFWFDFKHFIDCLYPPFQTKKDETTPVPWGQNVQLFQERPCWELFIFQRRISIFHSFIFRAKKQAGLIRHVRQILCSKWARGKTRVSARGKEGGKVSVCLLRVSSRVESASFRHWWPLCLVWADTD